METLDMRVADPWRRAFANMVDGLVVGVIAILVGFPAEMLSSGPTLISVIGREQSLLVGVVMLIAFVLYFCISHARWGQTLGKRAFRIRVVDPTTGSPPGYAAAALRALIYPGLAAVLVTPFSALILVDVLWMFWDDRCRCLHDKVAGTIVVDVR